MTILNERILRLVVTLAEELHFGRAAAVLHVSQPALSGTVKSLERDLGVRLFKRTSRNVELTDAGRVFVAEAGCLIQEGERVVALVRRSSSDVPGPLHIGYSPSMNFHWLGALISHARKQGFSSRDLQFVSSNAAHLQEGLTKGTYHAAFLAGRLCDPDLQCVTLFREGLAVVLSARHPLAHSALLAIDRLREEPVVWLRRDGDPLLYDGFTASCAAHGYSPKVVQEAMTFYECLQFAREGIGITFVPPFMQSSGGSDSVEFVRLPEGTLQVEYTLAYYRNGGSSGIDRFVKFVQGHIPDDRSAVSIDPPERND